MNTVTANRPTLAHAPRIFDTELFLLGAPTRAELPARIAQLQRGLELHPELPLRDFASSVSRNVDVAQACLAIVAESHADLRSKLARAAEKLGDPACRRIQDKAGIYWFEERLGMSGKVAWIFPGEGAQYPHMLGDLSVHFPDVRAMFDLVDLACRQEDATFVPSHYVFPPPGTTPSANGDDLFAWDAAVMAVVGANMAMMKLCRALHVPCHATMGHSFGEFSALEMGGILRGDEQMRESLLRLALRQIQEISGFRDIPDARLVNVGGAEREAIESLVAKHSPDLCVAMANCPHQYILCATGPQRDALAQTVISTLAAEGAICTPLPFHRPYHTPHFAPAMAVERRFYTQTGVHAPLIDTYSCCSADRFPQDAAGIVDVATRHWAEPVRFQETIERMHADGVRVFLEVGPRGNLCAFVDDILRDKPHVAIPTDREHRSTVSQLHRALGLLAAHGVPLNVEALHAARQSRAFDPARWDVPADDTLKRTVHMGLECPHLDAGAYVREVGPLRATGKVAPVSAGGLAPAMGVPTAPATVRDQVMASFLDTMNGFLTAQEQMLGYFSTPAAPPVPPLAPAPSRPMLGTVVDHVPDASIAIVKTFDVEHDLFLRDHTLGTQISAFDPELVALPIMPLLFSMEVMGEAALQLFPGPRVVTAHEDVRANQWIFFDRGQITLRVTAKRVASTDGDIRVRCELREERGAGLPAPCLVEATMVLSAAYPEPRIQPRLQLQEPEACNWTGTAIYPKRTFHGPRFQGIRRIANVGRNGLNGEIALPPRNTLYRGVETPALTYDPVLVDCMGQAIWIWGNRDLTAPYFYLPFSVDRLSLCQPPLPPGTPLTFDLSIREQKDGVVACDVRAMDANGIVCAEIVNLRDRAFEIPLTLKRMILEPIEHAFSEPWTPPLAIAALRGRWAFTRIAGFPVKVLESSFGVWRKAWAALVLNPPERTQCQAMEASPRRQIEWLWGRTCAKDAVRALLRGTGLGPVAAADIAIGEAPGGRPIVSGGWRRELPIAPAISIAHTEDVAIAAACDGGGSIGIDLERIRTPSADLLDGTLAPAEAALLPAGPERDTWFFRAWAAKEAVGKALGTGVVPDPKAFILTAIDRDSGVLQFRVDERGDPGRMTAQSGRLIAHTFRDGDYAGALCQIAPEETARTP